MNLKISYIYIPINDLYSAQQCKHITDLMAEKKVEYYSSLLYFSSELMQFCVDCESCDATNRLQHLLANASNVDVI